MSRLDTLGFGSPLAYAPYSDDIVALLNKYPSLNRSDERLDEECPSQQPTCGQSRVACIQFLEHPLVSHRVFETWTDLEIFLSAAPEAGSRRLFLLEELEPAYVTVLGHRLRVPPTLFSRHRRNALWDFDHDGGNVPPLPSLNDPSAQFSFQFWELVHFQDPIKDNYLRCADNERQIAVTRFDGCFDNVGIVQRKASFWSKPLPSDGWDGKCKPLLREAFSCSDTSNLAILIIDGPVKDILMGSRQTYHRKTIPCSPFQGGYADFIAYPDLDSAKTTSGPPRESLFDDLLYFFEYHSSCLTISTEPASCMLFFKKIMASHFMILSEYYRGVLSQLEYLLSRRETFAKLTLNWVEERCSDLHSFNRRCEEYQKDIASVMEQLDIPREGQHSHPNRQMKGEWTCPARDFLSLHSRFAGLKIKSWDLLASFTNLATIVGNRQSLAEARSVRSLTNLGLIFLPLSTVAGVFGMNDSFLPGTPEESGMGWMPFTMAAVLLVIVFWASETPDSCLGPRSGHRWWAWLQARMIHVEAQLLSAASFSMKMLRRRMSFREAGSAGGRSEPKGFENVKASHSPTADEERCTPIPDSRP